MSVPFDRPLCGPMRFDPTSVPPATINLPPGLMSLVSTVSSNLLNRAFELAPSNAARLSALNHLVINNFQNDNYPKMIELVLRLAANYALKQNRPDMVRNYIAQSVDEALTFLSSSVLATNPQMSAVCNAATVQAANQNHHLFLKARDDLSQLNLNAFLQPLSPQTQPPGTGQQSMTNTAPLFTNYSHSYANANQPDPNGAVSSFGGQWNQGAGQQQQPAQQSYQANDPLKAGAWFNNNMTAQNSNQTIQPVQVATNPNPIPVVDYQPQAVVATPFAAPVPIKPVPVPTTVVTCFGENEMDISNHTLPYFGSTDLVVDLSARRSDLQLEALNLAKEGKRLGDSNDAVLLEQSVMIETNLDSAIFTATVTKAHNVFRGRQNQVYRQFLHILSPVACSEEAKLAMGVFQTATTLSQVPDMFRSFLKIIRDPSNPQENEQQALNFYAYLDAKLRGSVNDFLKYQLRSPLIIGSFSEDFLALDNHLRKNVSENAAQALMAWSSKFFDQLRNGYNEAGEKLLNDFFSEESKASCGYFPTFQSVTILSLTNKELGYKAEASGSFIDPKTTGVLHSLASGLGRNKKDLSFYTSKDWLITADDYRYRIAEDAFGPGRYFLFPG